jgi:hypothetical protein
MKKMLKRADGSYSQRGLWDNIRANKGSGKKPTKEMLKQEKKIKAESKKMGGSWMEDSKELKFGGPKKYQTEGIKETPSYSFNWTVSPAEPEKETFFDRLANKFSKVAGGGNKGGGSTGFDRKCLSGDCLDMMSAKGGKETNAQNQGGAKGLSSSKQLERGRVIDKSEAQIALEQAGKDERAANRAEIDAKREAARIANKAALDASIAKLNAPTGVYGNPKDLPSIRMKKTGGKLFKKR